MKRKKNAELRKLVENMRLFQSLKESELSSINVWTDVERIGPGEFVLKEAEKGDCLYVVLEGKVEIFTLDEHGKVVILAVRGPGEYFGEQALLPGSSGQRSAYARSRDQARVLKVPKAYFRLILKRDSKLAQQLMKIGQAQKSQRAKLHKH
jgi:CRP-like cAMP-binding protein